MNIDAETFALMRAANNAQLHGFHALAAALHEMLRNQLKR